MSSSDPIRHNDPLRFDVLLDDGREAACFFVGKDDSNRNQKSFMYMCAKCDNTYFIWKDEMWVCVRCGAAKPRNKRDNFK